MWISRATIAFIAFMFSPAFKGLLIIMSLIADAFTTSLGLAPLVYKRMGLLMNEGGVDSQYLAIFSNFICVFFAVLLIWSISVATFHKRHIYAAVLSVLSILISFRGVAGDAYVGIASLGAFDLNLIIDTVFYSAFAVAPVAYVSLNSDLVIEQFNDELSSIVSTKNAELKKYIEASIKKKLSTANTVLDVSTSNSNKKAEKKRKGGNQPLPLQVQKSSTSIGNTTDLDELLNTYKNDN